MTPEALARMAERLTHRGPDGEGFYLDGALGFAHRRLSIIDVQGGVQPMIAHDAPIALIYNGEVYNYVELLAELKKLGRTPRTRSDTECVLLAYQEWGLDFVERLNGMFAIALWDGVRQRLVLCRDRMGIKPLYTAETRHGIAFASEVKALREVSGVDTSIDVEALDSFMSLGYVSRPHCLLRGVRKIEPGTLVTIEPGREPVSRRYWSFAFSPDQRPSMDDWVEEVRSVFDDAVRLRLRSDVPFGVLLSGGVDSSAIAATVARARGGSSVDTLCVGVDVEGAQTEFAWARQVARELGTRHHEQRLTLAEHTALVLEASAYLDEPLADPMCGQLLGLCRRVRAEGIKVILSGEGADELFFGYPIYRLMTAMELVQKVVPEKMRRGFLAPMLGSLAGVVPSRRVAKFLRVAAEPLEQRYQGLSFFDRSLKNELYLPSMRQRLAQLDPGPDAFADENGGPELLSRMAAMDCRSWLVDNSLFRADMMSMAASVELRVPFLDHRMVELAARIPARFKVQPHGQKLVLKRAMADRVSSMVLRRRKLGFPTPIASLLREGFGVEMERMLVAPDAWVAQFFDRAVIRRLFAAHRGGRNNSRVLWQLGALERWAMHFSARPEAPRSGPGRDCVV